MNKFFAIILKLGLIAFIIGLIVALVGLATVGFDFKALSNAKTETISSTFENEAAINKITIDARTSNVYVIFSDTAEKLSATYTVKCYKNSEKQITSIIETVNESHLTLVEERSFFGIINLWSLEETKIEITVPKSRAIALDVNITTGDTTVTGMATPAPIKVDATTGDITIDTVAANKIELESSTGDIRITNATCSSIEAEIGTGDIAISSVVCEGEIDVETSTGALLLRDVTAGAIMREGTTGDTEIRGAVKTKSFICDVNSGDIECEDGKLDAEKILIEATTGDVELNLVRDQSEYEISVNVTTGDSNIRNQNGGPGEIKVNATTSDVEIYFGK